MRLPSRRSIRTQLVTLYTLALLAILLPVLAGSYLFVRSHVLSSRDHELEGEAEEAFVVMSQWDLAGTPADALRRLEAVEDVWFELWRPGGELAYRSGLPEAYARLLPEPGTRSGAYSIHPGTDERLRVYEHPVTVGSDYLFRVIAPMGAVDSMLANLLAIHLVGLLAAVGLAGLSGHFLASRALAPVRLITERARVLTTDRLKEGIPVVDPADELGQLASTFNATFRRLDSTLGRLREFTADASHELRNPLAAIRNVAEVGLDGDARGQRRSLESILEEVERMTRILDGLLMMARMEHDPSTLAFEDVDLGVLARDVASQLSVLAEHHSQELRVTGQPGVRVRSDPMYLRQALMNIVDNAIKHGADREPIDIHVEIRGKDGVVSVVDRGPGIPAGYRERVFERFFAIDKERSRRLGGSGLGLAIAQWGIAANGGSIELESEAGAGAAFRIRLPLAGP